MMYFSKEELELIIDGIEKLFLDGGIKYMAANDLYAKLKHQLETM